MILMFYVFYQRLIYLSVQLYRAVIFFSASSNSLSVLLSTHEAAFSLCGDYGWEFSFPSLKFSSLLLKSELSCPLNNCSASLNK